MSGHRYPPSIHPSDLQPDQYDGIVEIIKNLPGVQRITLYGSRARGQHRYNSDVDLFLEGSNLGYQTRADAFRLLYDLWIPHEFDILIDKWLNNDLLRENIAREGLVLWEREKEVVAS